VIYTPAVLALLAAVEVHGLAHITGGGLPGNLSRILPEGTSATIDTSSWEVPRLFSEIARLGEVDGDEMARTFNMGIGLVAVVPPSQAADACTVLNEAGCAASIIGEVTEGEGPVTLL
jgi:phosphoribosylformylglycinamidine cyclo-ligase